jgi:hypothetical protein
MVFLIDLFWLLGRVFRYIYLLGDDRIRDNVKWDDIAGATPTKIMCFIYKKLEFKGASFRYKSYIIEGQIRAAWPPLSAPDFARPLSILIERQYPFDGCAANAFRKCSALVLGTPFLSKLYIITPSERPKASCHLFCPPAQLLLLSFGLLLLSVHQLWRLARLLPFGTTRQALPCPSPTGPEDC